MGKKQCKSWIPIDLSICPPPKNMMADSWLYFHKPFHWQSFLKTYFNYTVLAFDSFFVPRHFKERSLRNLFLYTPPGFLCMLTSAICTTDQDYFPQKRHSTNSWNLLVLIIWESMAQQGLENLHLKLIFLMLQFVKFDHHQLAKCLRCSSDMWRTNHGDFSRKRLELPFGF